MSILPDGTSLIARIATTDVPLGSRGLLRIFKQRALEFSLLSESIGQ
jgi:hypothetical protein